MKATVLHRAADVWPVAAFAPEAQLSSLSAKVCAEDTLNTNIPGPISPGQFHPHLAVDEYHLYILFGI